MLGGLSEKKVADESVQNILKNLKSDIELKIGKELINLQADSYKTQVVAGINYFIKAKIYKDEFLFVRVFKSLPHTLEKDKLISIKLSIKKLFPKFAR